MCFLFVKLKSVFIFAIAKGNGEILKRPTRADCKSADYIFAGSNPALPTRKTETLFRFFYFMAGSKACFCKQSENKKRTCESKLRLLVSYFPKSGRTQSILLSPRINRTKRKTPSSLERFFYLFYFQSVALKDIAKQNPALFLVLPF